MNLNDALPVLEDARNEITKDWIAGIRKAWKIWVDQFESYEGRVFRADIQDYELAKKARLAADGYLVTGRAFITRLREDLLILKGFWRRPASKTDKKKKTDGDKWHDMDFVKGKVMDLLREAEEVISDAQQAILFWEQAANPEQGEKSMWRSHHVEVWGTQEKFNKLLMTIAVLTAEAAQKVDSIVSGKLLRHLSTLTTKAGGKTDWGGYEPDVVQLGGVTVIFSDTPSDPTRASAQASEPEKARHPLNRRDYIARFKETEALLRRRKLGFLWYGEVEIFASGKAPENPLGAHFGVGAQYYRNGDRVVVFSDPSKSLVRLMAHELGHRYYFKFMNQTDRERFDEWFGKVKATSEYGATKSWEDFAEVFSEYVMGTDLTRDQIERFTEFLGRKSKRESLQHLVGRLRALSES